MKRRRIGIPAPPPAQAGDPVAQFLSWCASVRLTHPKCTVGQLPGTGRGVLATEAIREGEVVIEVPDQAVLMVESSCIAAELEGAGLIKGVAGDPLLEVQGLVLAVMAERSRGAASRWAPYLSFIPQDMGHMPMFWEADELSELEGTAALDKMEGKVQTPADAPTQVRMLWEELALPFIEEHPRLKLPSGDRGWALYQWATAAVSSYSFILGDDHYQAMVPFWDALNHITGAVNVRLNHHMARGGAGRLQMIATRDIAAGEELVNNYGELSQAELLRAYGYVERHPQANMHAHVQVPLRFVLQAVGAVLQGTPADTSSQQQDQGMAAPEADCGSDSDGASDWGLDSSDEDHDDGEQDGGQEEGDGEPPGGTGAAAAGAGGRADKAGRAGQTGAAGKAAGSGAGSGAGRGSGAGPLAAGADAGDGGTRDAMGMRAVRRAVRGLPGRLRFLRRVGLLPRANVLKVYQHTDSASRSGSSQVAECIRLLLLPWADFTALRQRVMAWRPCTTNGTSAKPTAASTKQSGSASSSHPPASGSDDQAGASGKGRTQPDGALAVGVVEPVVDVGPLGLELAGQVQRAVCGVAAHMLGRYTCSLEADEQLLALSQPPSGKGDHGQAAPAVQGTGSAAVAGAAGEGGVGGTASKQHQAAGGGRATARRSAAVAARAPEKRCLHALRSWWGGGVAGTGVVSIAGGSEAAGGVVEGRLVRAVQECWREPRPGMFGMASVAGASDDEDDDSESESEGTSSEGEEEEGEEEAEEEHKVTSSGKRGRAASEAAAPNGTSQAAPGAGGGGPKARGKAAQADSAGTDSDGQAEGRQRPNKAAKKTDTGFTFAFQL